MDYENRRIVIVITNVHTPQGNSRLHPNNFQPTILSPYRLFFHCFQMNSVCFCYFSVRTVWCRNPRSFHVGLTGLTMLCEECHWWSLHFRTVAIHRIYFFRNFLNHPQFLILLLKNKLKFPAMLFSRRTFRSVICV